jgi:hypothetical protein
MSKKFGIAITNPSALYTVGHIAATADNFTAVNGHVTGTSTNPLNDGVLVKNIGPLDMKVAFSGATHGTNTGFILGENEQIFVETTSIASVTVKNDIASQGITFSVYAN